MVKFVEVVDYSDLPYLGLVYSGDGLIVSSSFSFVSKKLVKTRMKAGVDRAVKRRRVLTMGRSSSLKEGARTLLDKMRRSIDDELIRLSLVDVLDIKSLTMFEKKVYLDILNIPLGETRSYKQVALEVGSSPRAVGQALARNPFSPIIPCHRVVRSDGSPGGFSGDLDSRDKIFMLQYEAEIAHELKEKRFVSWR